MFSYQLFSINEIFDGNVNNLEKITIIYSLIRDLIFFLILIVSFFILYRIQNKISYSRSILMWNVIFIVFSVIFSSINIIYNNNIIFSIALLKNIQPILFFSLIYLVIKNSTDAIYEEIKLINKTLTFIVFLELIFMIIELIYLPPYYGATFFGPRVVGTFLSPNTLGLSLTGILLLKLIFYKTYTKDFCIICTLLFFMVLLTGQRTTIFISLIILILYTINYFNYKFKLDLLTKMFFLIFLLVSSVYIFMGINSKNISGREVDFTKENRISIYNDFFNNLEVENFLYGSKYGETSNALKLLATDNHGFVSDSLYVTILNDFGVLLGTMLVIFFLWSLLKKSIDKTIVLVVFFLSSTTIVVIEATPFIYLFGLSLALVYSNIGAMYESSN